MAIDTAGPDLGWLYRDTRERLTALVSGLDEAALACPVPACPGWLVRDVMAHVTAVAEEAVAGLLTGPPSPEETAGQVARLAGTSVPELLGGWDRTGPAFEKIVTAGQVWPAVADAASHEQDIRGALGLAGARDCQAIWHCAGHLLARLDPPVRLRVRVEDGEFVAGPETGPELQLVTSRFDAFRWRMGRRSRSQLAALGWSGDPSAVLDHLVVFGPSPADIVE